MIFLLRNWRRVFFVFLERGWVGLGLGLCSSPLLRNAPPLLYLPAPLDVIESPRLLHVGIDTDIIHKNTIKESHENTKERKSNGAKGPCLSVETAGA
ncbi:hypothetical protein F5X96DRAFT_608368 [Biscogniauxia mediterranea]|nr:hypothetical protein F5X96DRAFT_608368 [Biscogniauxia mediterranea]